MGSELLTTRTKLPRTAIASETGAALWSAVQQLKDDLSDLRAHISDNYLRKDDFSTRWEEVLKAIHRVEDKLDELRSK